MPPNRVGRLLGHHFTSYNMVGTQTDRQASRARAVLGTLWGSKTAKAKTRVHLVKTLVFPHLTYPCIPLHTATNHQLGGLQGVQNEAIKYALGVSWFDFIPSAHLHNRFRFKFQPLNQLLYWRAKKVWEKISTGHAADLTQYNLLRNELEPEPDESYHSWFPSSINMVEGPEPPPMYTYYGHR